MPTLQDDEFGAITIRRSAKASAVRISLAPNGTLRASMPVYTPLFLLKRLIERSRPSLRKLTASHKTLALHDGMQIGKSHTLVVRATTGALTTARTGQQIIVSLPAETDLNNAASLVHKHVIDALRIEAKHYLPRRLAHLAQQHGFSYTMVRFSHASSRWGSCSSNGTISLNIALMKLPFELIDYVLVHELCHTVHMDHSSEFWQRVGSIDRLYALHKASLKNHSPSI